MEISSIGKWLVVSGAALVLLGAFFWIGDKIPWVGHLPGDIRIERENFSFYFPLTTCLILPLLIRLVLLGGA